MRGNLNDFFDSVLIFSIGGLFVLAVGFAAQDGRIDQRATVLVKAAPTAQSQLAQGTKPAKALAANRLATRG